VRAELRLCWPPGRRPVRAQAPSRPLRTARS
jgi:hypothetical protein